MKNSKNPLIEEEFRTIEKKLVEIITSMGYLKGRSAKTSEIMAYIYVRQEVTQKLLRELTRYSLGTISTALQHLENLGVVRKHPDPNTRQYHYKLDGTPSQIQSRSMMDFQGYFSQIKEFLQGIEAKLSRPPLSKKRGYKNIRQFLDEMNVLIPAYEHVVQKFQTMVSDISKEEVGVTSDL